MAPFWERTEARLQALVADRRRVARLFVLAYWVGTAVVVLGVVIIILSLAGAWRP